MNIEREISFIYDLKKKNKENDYIIKLKDDLVISKKKGIAIINLEYFGGVEFDGSTVFDFFRVK